MKVRLAIVIGFLMAAGLFSPAFGQRDPLPWIFEEVIRQGGTWDCVPAHEWAAPDDGFIVVFRGIPHAALTAMISEGGYPPVAIKGRMDENPAIEWDNCPAPPPPLAAEDRASLKMPEKHEWSMNLAPAFAGVAAVMLLLSFLLGLFRKGGAALMVAVLALAIGLLALAI